jgi:hypothetical protein
MQFWQDFTPGVRWTLALGSLLAIVLLTFRQCDHAPPVEVQTHRGIGAFKR